MMCSTISLISKFFSIILVLKTNYCQMFTLISMRNIEAVNNVKCSWEIDLATQISQSEWHAICGREQKFFLNVAIQEHIFKIFHCWHLTLLHLSKMFPGSLDTSWRCGQSKCLILLCLVEFYADFSFLEVNSKRIWSHNKTRILIKL